MELLDLIKLLEENPYPGRGIVLGRSAGHRCAIAAYFIMGRSENSRYRVFDPSLIIYHPVRQVGRGLVVTNGDQTDTVRDGLLAGKTFAQALHTREFEPDAPNYTPRISGLLSPDGSFKLSILKSADGNPACCCRFFYTYDHPLPGEGRFIHTWTLPRRRFWQSGCGRR